MTAAPADWPSSGGFVQFTGVVLGADGCPPRGAAGGRVRSAGLREIQQRSERLVGVQRCGVRQLGHGAFARRAVEVGEYVLEYTGERKHGVVWDQLESSQTRYMWDLGGGEAIDAERCGNESRFLNHHQHIRRSPNLEAVNVREADGVHVLFRSVCEIRAGEQLVIDYGRYFKGVFCARMRGACVCVFGMRLLRCELCHGVCVYFASAEMGREPCAHDGNA